MARRQPDRRYRHGRRSRQGDLLYNELKLAGKVTEMFRLPGVPPEPFGAGLALRVQRAEAILDWMDRWLKPTNA